MMLLIKSEPLLLSAGGIRCQEILFLCQFFSLYICACRRMSETRSIVELSSLMAWRL
jgi:hypothetical protein